MISLLHNYIAFVKGFHGVVAGSIANKLMALWDINLFHTIIRCEHLWTCMCRPQVAHVLYANRVKRRTAMASTLPTIAFVSIHHNMIVIVFKQNSILKVRWLNWLLLFLSLLLLFLFAFGWFKLLQLLLLLMISKLLVK